jgi:hypothetical protein
MLLQVKLIFAVCIYTYAPVHTCCKLNVNFVRSLARPECTNNCMHVACTVRPVVDPSCSTRRYPPCGQCSSFMHATGQMYPVGPNIMHASLQLYPSLFVRTDP